MPMKIDFKKYSAHGNDFLIIDNRNYKISGKNTDTFRRMCERRTSVGADGIILLDSAERDFRLQFFNSDGLSANMCGNGSRAGVHFANSLGLIPDNGIFVVNGRKHGAKLDKDGNIAVELFVESDGIDKYEYTYKSKTYTGYSCNTGVQHLVLFNDGIYDSAPLELANMIRYSPEFEPEGTNVSFLKMKDKDNIYIKTFEKGVEDYTLSCGTAAAAASLTAVTILGCSNPVNIHSRGGTLNVTKSPGANSLWIAGLVNCVYSGFVPDISLRVE